MPRPPGRPPRRDAPSSSGPRSGDVARKGDNRRSDGPPRDARAPQAARDAQPRDARGARDAQPRDARGPRDAQPRDARGPRDAQPRDARGPRDAQPRDAQPRDARGPRDARARGPRDAQPRDARAPQASRDGRTQQPPREPRAGREAPRSDVGTEITYGLRAGIALLARRPADVARVALGREAQLPEVEEALAPLRGRVDVRDGLEERDLAQLAGTTHHEGLVVVARPRVWIAPAALAELLVARRGTAIALDRVRNPYNVGAILRSAAFFGIDAVLLGAPAPHPGLPPDAVRVAEGGVEHLALTRTTDLADTLGRLAQRGVAIVGAESDGSASAIGYEFRRPAVLVLGHEREGLSPRVRARCGAMVAIRGSGAVESLNVAVAASVMISELCRR